MSSFGPGSVLAGPNFRFQVTQQGDHGVHPPCAETVATCPLQVVAATREELMQHVGIHAKMAHPEMAANPPSPELMENLIHQE